MYDYKLSAYQVHCTNFYLSKPQTQELPLFTTEYCNQYA